MEGVIYESYGNVLVSKFALVSMDFLNPTQLQQASAESHLPPRNQGGLQQLYATGLLERRLSAGGPQLPDTG